MATDTPVCHLTTKDHLVLEAMIEHCRNPEASFKQMLLRKVRDSQLYLREDIPEDVATLGCWVTYCVNGETTRTHQLVAHESVSAGGGMLSIHSMHGLALLGLAEGASVRIEGDNEETEILLLVKIVLEAQLGKEAAIVQPTGDVISFQARKKQSVDHAWLPDDDPGPSAA